MFALPMHFVNTYVVSGVIIYFFVYLFNVFFHVLDLYQFMESRYLDYC